MYRMKCEKDTSKFQNNFETEKLMMKTNDFRLWAV